MDNYIKVAKAIIKEASQQMARRKMMKAAIWPLGRLGTHSAPEPEEQAAAMARSKQDFLNWLATQPGNIADPRSQVGIGYRNGKNLFPGLTLPANWTNVGPEQNTISGPAQRPVKSVVESTKKKTPARDLPYGQQTNGYQRKKMLENPNWDPYKQQ